MSFWDHVYASPCWTCCFLILIACVLSAFRPFARKDE